MKSVLRGRLASFTLALVIGAAGALADDGGQNSRAKQFESDGPSVNAHETNPIDAAPTQGGTGALSPIINHHGPVMTTPTPYLIWYGNWAQLNGSDNLAGQLLVKDFLFGENNSPYFKINTTYGASGSVGGIGGETTVNAAARSRLSDNGVFSVVSNAITNHKLPLDSNGVYFVITSSDIAKSGFCTQYCGWHTRGTVGGTDIKYSFVGNANRCLNACAAQTVGPNGNAGVDGMLSVIAHELQEATSDPDLNAWYDASGNENADKCAWTFGQNQTLGANGAYYNMSLPAVSGGTRNYLIQRNLSAIDNKCYVSLNGGQ
ncbi:MAG TPA: hypothetical protein VNY05_21765 [Candidatus Acidoferrales bacterium]|jgi:hypothetical protein|nr:hypothetical protein [Candidatus Acidoferrales bacterium]